MSQRDREMLAAIAAIEDQDEGMEATASVQPPRQPSQVYSIRIPVERIEQLRGLAAREGVPPTQLMRRWVIERLDHSLETAKAPKVVKLTEVRPTRPIDDLKRFTRVSA